MPAYIIIFKDSASGDQVQDIKNKITSGGGSIKQDLGPVMKGFSAELPDQAMGALQEHVGDGIIDYIEPEANVATQ